MSGHHKFADLVKEFQEVRARNYKNLKEVIDTYNDSVDFILDFYAIHGDKWLAELDSFLQEETKRKHDRVV